MRFSPGRHKHIRTGFDDGRGIGRNGPFSDARLAFRPGEDHRIGRRVGVPTENAIVRISGKVVGESFMKIIPRS